MAPLDSQEEDSVCRMLYSRTGARTREEINSKYVS
jgi:hypothetical protein